MPPEMKQLLRLSCPYGRRPLIGLASTCVLFLFTSEALAAGGGKCHLVTGSAQGGFTGPAAALTQVQLTMGGDRVVGTSVATIKAQRESHTAILALTSHVFEFGGDGDGRCEAQENCFETADDATLWAPPDSSSPYVLDSKLLILEGKGRFKNVSGNLRAIGTVDFSSGAVQWKVWGTLNRCGPND